MSGPTESTRFEAWKVNLRRRSTVCFRLRVLFVVLFAIAAVIPATDDIRVALAAVALVSFTLVAVFHRRIDRAIARTDALLLVRRQQQARRNLAWDQLPPALPIELPSNHPFAGDLDLFGSNGLHRFLDISVSRQGSRLLASWLSTEEASIDEIHERQRLVRALIPGIRFRERLLLTFSLVSRERLDGEAFLRWLTHSRVPAALGRILSVSAALAVVNVALFLAWGYGLLPPWFLISLFLYAVLYFRNVGIRDTFIDAAVRFDDELSKLVTVFHFLERANTGSSEAQAELLRPFRDAFMRPSRHIRRVRVDVIAAGLSMNPVMMVLLNLLLPWDFFFAQRLEKKRAELATVAPVWLTAMHRLEALQSLANYGWLFPDTTFPHLQQGQDTGAAFVAKSLGHPLLPHSTRTRNDVSLAGNRDILLITGSNMSGKSTLLRTIGVSAVLALAGAPVDAHSLTLKSLRLFTCIHISDSLRDGVSYFYAEVKRLRRLLDLLREDNGQPTIFLIDEMFRGTNTRERHEGGEAFIRELIRLQASGVISTHDIALTNIADVVPGVRNMHFREAITDGRMTFDYTLRSGPCPTTNALVIMRLEGLPVPDDAVADY
ncbi:MAG: hypothetical protein M5R41_14720 [Bacteroidia bacterium]|nr:hypothetical protein [Bacteroidia bacterium]